MQITGKKVHKSSIKRYLEKMFIGVIKQYEYICDIQGY